MSTQLLKKLFQPRRSRTTVAVAVASVLAVMAVQNMGTAAAGTDATREEHLEGCQKNPPRACLWIHAKDDPDPANAADRRALVITPGSGPDIDEATTSRFGKVHGVTEEFTDNISVGWNHLPYDLCLMDTSDYRDTSRFGQNVPLRKSDFVLVVRPGKAFAQLDNMNDKIDYYTTARKGQCPRGGIVFRSDNEEIISRS